jgi:hypothetical protein
MGRRFLPSQQLSALSPSPKTMPIGRAEADVSEVTGNTIADQGGGPNSCSSRSTARAHSLRAALGVRPNRWAISSKESCSW